MGKLFGGGGGAGPVLDKSKFDLSKQAKKYEDISDEQRAYNQSQNRALASQLQQQATGVGPLANAALKTAQNRNLAQTLAAAQSAGASPLNTRNLLQARGQQSRDLAELSMQDRLASQQALGAQLGQSAQIAGADIGQGFGIARAPVDSMKEYEMTRFGADVARQNQIKQQQGAIGSALLGAGGSALQGYLSGPKTAAHGTIVKGHSEQSGDSVENDKVPHLLSSGEMVVPKSVVKQGPKAIKTFAQTLLELENESPSAINGFAALVAMKGNKRG